MHILCRRPRKHKHLQGPAGLHGQAVRCAGGCADQTPPASTQARPAIVPLLWQGSSPFEYRGLETESDDDETPRGLPAAVAAAHASMNGRHHALMQGMPVLQGHSNAPPLLKRDVCKRCPLSGAQLPPVSNALVLTLVSLRLGCITCTLALYVLGVSKRTGYQMMMQCHWRAGSEGHIHCARSLPPSAPARL